MGRWSAQLAFGAAIAYLLLTGWAMQRITYDVWGALVIGPMIVVCTVPLLRRLFLRSHPDLLRLLYIGLAAKLAGTLARYWVIYVLYDGAADSQRYHDSGRLIAQEIRSGEVSLLSIFPTGVGTAFIDNFAGTVYTVFGSSRLAGFLLFATLGYWGAVLFIRAAMLAVPGLELRRYSALMVLLPSLMFWPSSIGKEAWMMLALGMASLGGAMLFTGRPAVRSIVVTALGLAGAALVRPHMAGMWLGGLVLGLAAMVFGRRVGSQQRSRFVALIVLGIAAIGFAFVAGLALHYLQPSSEDESASSAVNSVFQETERRSETGGSSFDTIDVSSPTSWPFAIVRTLTRPMPNEANSLVTLMPAAEMALLLLAALVDWRRFANVLPLMRTTPYIAFAMAVVLMWGLAFTSIGNLGILARQRSLVLPLFVLPWCLPARRVSSTPTLSAERSLVSR